MTLQARTLALAAALTSILCTASASAADRQPAVYAGASASPIISHLICPDYNNSGNGIYVCRVIFSSSTPATVRWPDGSDANEYMGVCYPAGRRLSVTVTVTNAAGATSRTNTFACPGNLNF